MLGGSRVIAPDGRIVASAPRHRELVSEPELLVADYYALHAAGQTGRLRFWMSVLGHRARSTLLPMLLGAVVGVASTNPDQIAELHTLTGGVGWLVMIVFALGIMDTNSINLYGGVLCSITTGQTVRAQLDPRRPGAGHPLGRPSWACP